jgi:hypothetical protein
VSSNISSCKLGANASSSMVVNVFIRQAGSKKVIGRRSWNYSHTGAPTEGIHAPFPVRFRENPCFG